AFLAGLDKFFNLLTNWEQYLNPMATRVVPVDAFTFMRGVGVIEMVVCLIILSGALTRLGAYVACAWLVCIALNLITMGAFFDIAVRDLGLAIGAFSLARLTEVRGAVAAKASATESHAGWSRRTA